MYGVMVMRIQGGSAIIGLVELVVYNYNILITYTGRLLDSYGERPTGG